MLSKQLYFGCFLFLFIFLVFFVSGKSFGYSFEIFNMDTSALAFLSVFMGFFISVAVHIYDI
ncbi:hypothetical protein [Neisseria meningitidis]|uniref:hypothetical protein n=1 Tax=Neisseria meningitidis TaxID=487 RepID=UPI002F354C99